MPPPLEKRVEELERKFDELSKLTGDVDAGRNWQKTFAFSREDKGFQDLAQLGQQYRRNLAHRDPSADS